MKKKKFIIGLVVGIVLSTIIVYAEVSYIGAANDTYYDSSNSSLTSTNVQDTLDEIFAAKTGCPIGNTCYTKVTKEELQPGDYIFYTPSAASYQIAATTTGATGTQTIYPNRTTLWRVLRTNNDNAGRVEIVSAYVADQFTMGGGQSDSNVCNGYFNFANTMQTIASQYENTSYTVGSRHFGYDGQTLSVTFSFSSNAESAGNGDTYYTTDLNLITNALGTSIGTDSGGTAYAYYTSSRYKSSTGTNYTAGYRYINTSGAITQQTVAQYYSSSSYRYCQYTSSNALSARLRPIVYLSGELVYYGNGTLANPYKIANTISS